MTLRIYTDDNVRPETWVQDAACATTNIDLWFPDHGDKRTAEEAKRICRDVCPVTAQCLAYAMRTRQTVGIWGGVGPKHIGRLRKEARS